MESEASGKQVIQAEAMTLLSALVSGYSCRRCVAYGVTARQLLAAFKLDFDVTSLGADHNLWMVISNILPKAQWTMVQIMVPSGLHTG
jgi:aromatic ring-opening dioxygenase catalytic subunit (LigB family)